MNNGDRSIDPGANHLLDQEVHFAARSNTTVLISGDTRLGRNRLARAVHQHSERPGPLVSIHCGDLPEGLERDLFGRSSGSDMVADQRGWFDIAHRGTIFMDEIETISFRLQERIMRFLERETRRVGDSAAADVRLIAGTAPSLFKRVQQGCFRADLYYRLNVVHLEVPLERAPAPLPCFVSSAPCTAPDASSGPVARHGAVETEEAAP